MAVDLGYGLYGSEPSTIPCAVFIGVFFPLIVYHFMIMVSKRCLFWWPFLLGLVLELIGCDMRIVSKRDPDSVMLYAIQSLFLLLPASLFAASIYMCLGRLLVYIKAEQISPVRVKWMTKIFIIGDVIAFLAQAGGGGLQAKGGSQELGANIVIGGLVVQLLFFGGFILTAGIVDFRLRRLRYHIRTPGKYQWRTLLYALYVASLLILVRCVYRVVEYSQGFDGNIMQNEVYLWVLDVTLMAIVGIIFSVVHPALVMVSYYDARMAVPLDRFDKRYQDEEAAGSRVETNR